MLELEWNRLSLLQYQRYASNILELPFGFVNTCLSNSLTFVSSFFRLQQTNVLEEQVELLRENVLDCIQRGHIKMNLKTAKDQKFSE